MRVVSQVESIPIWYRKMGTSLSLVTQHMHARNSISVPPVPVSREKTEMRCGYMLELLFVSPDSSWKRGAVPRSIFLLLLCLLSSIFSPFFVVVTTFEQNLIPNTRGFVAKNRVFVSHSK